MTGSSSPINDGRAEKMPGDARLYQATIQHFTCQGLFSISTTADSSFSGTCHGIRSKMEDVNDLGVRTRGQALREFAAAVENKAPPRSVILLHTKSDDDNDTDECDTDDYGSVMLAQAWTSLGSTSVQSLQLDAVDNDNDPTEIAAVTPQRGHGTASHCTMEGQGSYFGVGLHQEILLYFGFQGTKNQLCHQPGFAGDSNESEAKDSKETQPLPRYPSVDQMHALMSEDNLWGPAAVLFPARTTLRQAAASTNVAMNQYLGFSKRLVLKMQSNNTWLWHNLQNDMLRRTIQSGKRITVQMPKTAALLTKLIRHICGFDDE